MLTRLLPVLLLIGCAAGRTPAPAVETAAEDEPDAPCRRVADVTVHVDNRSSFSVQISFGSYTPTRAVLGLSRTTYRVPRYYLEHEIRLRIVGGGLELGAAPPIPTDPVACNDATLIIGPRPRYSFFYGDRVEREVPPDSGR